MYAVSCHHCKKRLSFVPGLAGKVCICPNCSGKLVMPEVTIVKAEPLEPILEDELDFLDSPSKPITKKLPVKKKQPNRSLVVAGVVVCSIVLIFMVGFIFNAVSSMRTNSRETIKQIREQGDLDIKNNEDATNRSIYGTTTPGTSKLMTREELKRIVVGKTEGQVIELIGRPDSTSEMAVWTYWMYGSLTKDPVSQKNDNMTQLIFENGCVTGINFF